MKFLQKVEKSTKNRTDLTWDDLEVCHKLHLLCVDGDSVSLPSLCASVSSSLRSPPHSCFPPLSRLASNEGLRPCFLTPLPSLACSQLLAELSGLPLSGLEGGFGVHQLVQLPADPGHVELRGLALLPEGGRLRPQLRGGHGELLAALAALHLHPLGVVQEGLHAHRHRVALVV